MVNPIIDTFIDWSVVIRIKIEEDLESEELELESEELELTCDDSYFRYCKYKSDHQMKWKSDFDKYGDRILYKSERSILENIIEI